MNVQTVRCAVYKGRPCVVFDNTDTVMPAGHVEIGFAGEKAFLVVPVTEIDGLF